MDNPGPAFPRTQFFGRVGNMKTYALRLHPGQGLREGIESFIKEKGIKAGVVITCVGNLKKAVLRMAGAKTVKTYEEDVFEIVSLVGTVGKGGSHLHCAISDKDGSVFGGHLKEESLVGFTAEVAIGEFEGMTFKRELDDDTGFEELVIE